MSAGPPIQSISIPRSEARSQPGPPHRVYAIVVSLPVRSWTVYRRYSDFLALHNAFLANTQSAAPPPAPLPPKHAARHAIRTISTLGGWLSSSSSSSSDATGTSSAMSEKEPLEQRERRLGLETYLRAIVASTDPHWRTRNEFLDFLELPRSSVINNSAGSSTTAAEKARLNRTAPTGSSTGSRGVPMTSGREPLSSPSTTFPSVAMPGAAPASSSSSSSSKNSPAAATTAITRQLGPAATPRADAQPGEHLAHQQALLDAQDASLQDLTSIIRRQRAVGLAINHELAEQNELLGALDDELESTGTKMKHAEGKMEQLEGKKKKK